MRLVYKRAVARIHRLHLLTLKGRPVTHLALMYALVQDTLAALVRPSIGRSAVQLIGLLETLLEIRRCDRQARLEGGRNAQSPASTWRCWVQGDGDFEAREQLLPTPLPTTGDNYLHQISVFPPYAVNKFIRYYQGTPHEQSL